MSRTFTLSTLMLVLSGFALVALAATPVSFKRDDSDTVNELIVVTCSDGKEGYVIKKQGERQYCTGKDGNGGYCSISKVKASSEVCKS
jgi:hypothetical protein